MTPNIIEFVTDPQLLGLSLSPAQDACLRTIYGLPLSNDSLDLYRQCTGRQAVPMGGFGVSTVIAGARSGKDSRIAGPMVCYEASFAGHEQHLGTGERGYLPLLAQDARATAIARGYVFEYFRRSPVLRELIAEEFANELELVNRLTIACFPCTRAALRGWSIPAAALSELAFWRLEGGAESDAEVQMSVRRGMLAFPSPRLVKISTPYLKSGVLYADHKAAWGLDNPDLLVWTASTALMNPTITPERLEQERRLDPVRFAREYEATFANDVDAFLSPDIVDDAVISGRRELAPMADRQYVASTDPSGGGADAFSFSIVHVEGKGADRIVVQDVLRAERGVSDLTGLVRQYVELCNAYGCTSVTGDKYAAGWVSQAWREAGVEYRPSIVDRSTAFLEAAPLFRQGRIELLDDAEQARELKNLERRPRHSGRDLVTHPHGNYRDDRANVVCLGAAVAIRRGGARPLRILNDAPDPRSVDQVQADFEREQAERAAESARDIEEICRRDGSWGFRS